MRSPFLMSASHPTGEKLEDVLDVLIKDIGLKSDRIRKDERSQAQSVLQNNNRIVALLREAKVLHDHSQAVLADLGADQGPRGKPRVGEGSDGYDPVGSGIRGALGRHGVGT